MCGAPGVSPCRHRVCADTGRRDPSEAITNAEKDAAYTEQALADAERSVAAKQKAHDEAVAKLAKLRTQKAAGEVELAEIDAELQKLAQLV